MGIDGARGMNSQILVVEFRGVKGQYDTWAKKLARERPGQVQPEYELYLTREWCCMPDVSSCRERLWRSMKGTLMALPKGVSHLDSYDRRWSPNFGCALSVECGLATPLAPRKGNGQDEDTVVGRTIEVLRKMN